MRFWELRRAAAAVVFPNRCPFCDELIGITDFWCERCYNRLNFFNGQEEAPQRLDGFSAVCRYTGRARTAVIRMKRGYYRYPIDAFAVLIAENAHDLITAADLITAVPASKERKNDLGYAQSELIAKMTAEMVRKPFKRVLEVTPEKQEQKRLTIEQRRENAQKAYLVTGPEHVQGKTVLVIDDVCTTGATLDAIADKLRAAGAASVSGAVFAKTAKR
ncbi:MAG: ComF family protein [Oscillospiraceae bacterium]